MSTDLVETAAEPVADSTDELQLIARSPAEMKTAQQSLVEWCKRKIQIVTRDADELAEEFEIASRNKWKTSIIAKHRKLALKRVEFYRKVQAAVEAGYCIVPNFPVEIFAIRTNRKTPERLESSWIGGKEQHSEGPPIGEGEIKHPDPFVKSLKIRTTDAGGKEVEKLRWFASSFDDEMEFPISVQKPLIMSATAEAIAMKCFDELGVLPAKQIRRADPIVVGIIKRPRGQGEQRPNLTFLIAWYVDTKAI